MEDDGDVGDDEEEEDYDHDFDDAEEAVAFWHAVGEAMFGDDWNLFSSDEDEDEESDEEEAEEGDGEGELEELEVEPSLCCNFCAISPFAVYEHSHTYSIRLRSQVVHVPMLALR